MLKRAIREAEEDLPTITESIMKMNPLERLSCLMTYHQVGKHVTFSQTGHISILDIGCGDGLFLRRFFDMIPQGRNDLMYVGIDISLRKLHFAQNNAGKSDWIRIHFVLADAESLPFRASVFDIATIIEVIEHLPDPSALISELDRAIRPDGKVIITTPSAYGTKGNSCIILKRLCFLKHSVSHREKYIVIRGKKLPHRDFTLNEITTILLPHFGIVKIYSFNFGAIYHVLARVLADRILALIILYFENHAPKLPSSWGNNWLIYAKKSYENAGL